MELKTATRPVKTWMYEVYSPFSAPAEPVEWVNYHSTARSKYDALLPETVVTGITLTDSDIAQYKKQIEENLVALSTKMGQTVDPRAKPFPEYSDSLESVILDLFDSSKQAIRGLDLKNLEQIFEDLYNKKDEESQRQLSLYVDIACASGTAGPIKMILDGIRANKISNERATSFFINLPNSFMGTPVVPELISFMKSLDINKNPFFTTQVYIGLTGTLKRVCIHEHSSKYATPFHVFGNEHCNAEEVSTSVINYLEKRFYEVDEEWQRAVIVKAIGNLGSMQAIPTLSKMLVSSKQSVEVKRTILYGLTHPNLPHYARDKVFQLLQPIIQDQRQETILRQEAVIAIMTWRPSAAWWHRLSMMSWHEKSSNMGAFIYFIIESNSRMTDPSFNKEIRVSQFLKPITKAYAPSNKYSYIDFYGQLNTHSYLTNDVMFSSLRTEHSRTPVQTTALFTERLGGLRFLLGEISTSRSIHPETMAQVAKNLERFVPENLRSNVRSVAGRLQSDVLENMMKSSGLSSNSVVLYVRMFDNMQYYAPLNSATFAKAFGQDGMKIVNSWMGGKNIELVKYFEAAPVEIFRPTELGVPLLATHVAPVFSSALGNTKLTTPSGSKPSIFDVLQGKNINIGLDAKFKLGVKNIIIYRTLMPWSQETITCGVDVYRGMNVPAKMALAIVENENTQMRNVSLRIEPTESQKFPFYMQHVIPYLQYRSMWPLKPRSEGKKYMALSLSEKSTTGVNKIHAEISKDYYGVEGSFDYTGDVTYPVTWGHLVHAARDPDTLASLIISPSIRLQKYVLNLEPGRSDTKAFHGSLAFSTPFSKSYDSFYTDLLQVNTTAMFESRQPRYYEFGARYQVHEDSPNRKSGVFDFHYSRLPVPNIDRNSAGYCLRIESELPNIKSFDSLAKLLRSDNAEVKYSGSLSGGKSCHDQTIATMTGSMKLSSERSQMLYKELMDDCHIELVDPLANLRTAPVYDVVNFNVKYHEPMPVIVRNTSYQIYDMVRGFSYPFIYFNYLNVKNPSKQLNLHGHRSVSSGVWDMQVKLPTENIVFNHFKLSPAYDSILPVGGLRINSFVPSFSLDSEVSSSSKMILEADLSNACIITKEKVRTFDGLKYKYSPESCATIAVNNRQDPEGPTVKIIKDPKNGILEAIIGFPRAPTSLYFSTREMTQMNEPITVTSEKKILYGPMKSLFATAQRVGKYIEVVVPGNFSIRLTDNEVEIMPAPETHGQMTGLCGDFNGDVKNELIGPENCIYSKARLFQSAWTIYEGSSCERKHVQELKKDVIMFQKSCPHVPVSESETTQSWQVDTRMESEECLETVWPVTQSRRGASICVSESVVGRCLAKCKPASYKTEPRLMSCYSEDRAPIYAKKHLDRGFVRHPLQTPSIPLVQTTENFTNVRRCVPRK